jgi:hypothetical protein
VNPTSLLDARTESAPQIHVFGLVPIVVSTTGHRDIPDQDIHRLESVIVGELRSIAEAHPNSPLLLLTGLAEGSDRLVARCAVKSGWRLGAVLPLEQSDYETDFANDASREEFRALLDQSAWIRMVNADALPRPACYRIQGEWLAHYSQKLLALWDGKEGNGEGGTSEVVHLFLNGLPSTRPILPDAGPVIHIATRRIRNLNLPAEPDIGKVSHLAPTPGGLGSQGEEDRWASILGRIDQFNADARRELAESMPTIEQSRSYLNAGKVIDSVGTPHSAISASWLHSVADTISSKAQAERDRLFLTLIVFAFIAIFFEQLYSGPFPQPILMAVSIAAGFGGFLVFLNGSRDRLEDRYLDYRSLAEACRVQYFWSTAGLEARVEDHFLREQRDELEWIRQAVRSTALGSVRPIDDSRDNSKLELVRDCWIDDQFRYFAGNPDRPEKYGKAEGNRLMDTKWSARAGRLFLLGIGAAIVVTPFHGFFAESLPDVGDGIVQALIVGYGMLFASAGVCKVYLETKAFSEQANRYQRMALSMSLARSRLDKAISAGDANDGRIVISEIGKEALAENGDWLLVHRDRPVKVPLG